MKVGRLGRLYVAGGTLGQIFVYDIASKALIVKFTTAISPTFVNDVTLAPNGDAYFTDSRSPFIYRVAADVTIANALERISLTGSPIVYQPGFNLNGIATNGKYLVMVQSNTGKLFRMDIATRQIIEINLGGQTLTGGDGILLDGRTLYVMRNAAQLLVTLRLSSDFAQATVLSSTSNPDFMFPTTFAQIGDRFLVVNSQLDKQATGNPVLPFFVLNIPVPSRAHH